MYKPKIDGNDKLLKYKARLLVKGVVQKKVLTLMKYFFPVVKMTYIHVILGLTANMDLELEQLDVKTAFLPGDLEEQIYMEQPDRFNVKEKERMIYKLTKSLYILK